MILRNVHRSAAYLEYVLAIRLWGELSWPKAHLFGIFTEFYLVKSLAFNVISKIDPGRPFEMSNRFYSDKEIKVGISLDLSDSESHHLIHVMRAKTGDNVTLFNDSGNEFSATIAGMTKKIVTVDVLAMNEANRELDFELVIASPLPKSDRQKFLIEKLTEVGVTEFIPLNTTRTSVASNPKVLEKLRRLVIESSKQCGRNRLMKISRTTSFSDLCRVEGESSRLQDFERLIAIPTADRNEKISSNVNMITMIGPEGGFSNEEVALAEDLNWKPINLGKSILRMETAALAAAILLRR